MRSVFVEYHRNNEYCERCKVETQTYSVKRLSTLTNKFMTIYVCSLCVCHILEYYSPAYIILGDNVELPHGIEFKKGE